VPVSPQKELEPSHEYKIDYEKIKNLEEAKQKERVKIVQDNPQMIISEILQLKDKTLGSDFLEIKAK
jgi:hypothetical protein